MHDVFLHVNKKNAHGVNWIFPFHQVGAGLECGIGVDDFDEWEEGDVVEAFNTVKKARTLEEASATVTAALKDAGVQLQNWR